jgi:hypothetical protein
MTLWGNTAQTFPEDVGSAVVAFKGVQVSDWNTKSLGMGRSSRMQARPQQGPSTPSVSARASSSHTPLSSRQTTLSFHHSQIDPTDVPDAKRLRAWADNGGAALATTLSVNTRSEGGGGGASAGDDLAELQEAALGLEAGVCGADWHFFFPSLLRAPQLHGLNPTPRRAAHAWTVYA